MASFQQINLTDVHSVVIDESTLGSKKLQMRVYNTSGTQIAVINITTDRVSADVVVITHPYVPAPPPPPAPPPSPTITVNGNAAGMTCVHSSEFMAHRGRVQPISHLASEPLDHYRNRQHLEDLPRREPRCSDACGS